MYLFILASCREEIIFLVGADFKSAPLEEGRLWHQRSWVSGLCVTLIIALALFHVWEALHLCSLPFSPP